MSPFYLEMVLRAVLAFAAVLVIAIFQNLGQNDLDKAWLIHELNKQGIKKPSEVQLAVLGTNGALSVDKKEDDLVHHT